MKRVGISIFVENVWKEVEEIALKWADSPDQATQDGVQYLLDFLNEVQLNERPYKVYTAFIMNACLLRYAAEEFYASGLDSEAEKILRFTR